MRKILIVLFFLVLVGGVLLFLKKEKTVEAPGMSDQIRNEGSSQISSPSGETVADIASEFEKLIAVKYHKSVESVKVRITKRQGDFIIGGVAFDGGEGGYLLGVKLMSLWKIVFDGNGSVPCSSVDPIQFPASLQAECWDTKTNQLVDRTKRPGIILQQ